MRRQELSRHSIPRREDVGRITVGVDFDPTPLRYVDLRAVFDPESTVANPATFSEEEASRTIVDQALEMSDEQSEDRERETASAQDESFFDCDRYASEVDDADDDEYGEDDSDSDLPADEEEPEEITARGQDTAIPIHDDAADYDPRTRGDSLYADDENDEPCDDLPYVPAPRPLAAHESLVLLARKAISATGPTPTPMATAIPIPAPPFPSRPRLPEAPASLAPLALDSLERYTNAIPPAPYMPRFDADATFTNRRNLKKRLAFVGAALGVGALVSIIAASEMSRGAEPESHAAVATHAAAPDLEMQKRDQLQGAITHAVPIVAPDVTHAAPPSTPSPWTQNIMTKHAPPASHAKDAHAASSSTAANDDNAKAAQALSDAQLAR